MPFAAITVLASMEMARRAKRRIETILAMLDFLSENGRAKYTVEVNVVYEAKYSERFGV